MFHPLTVFIFLNLFISNFSLALKILFVNPKFPPFNSHFAFAFSLAKSLVKSEHNVHMLAAIVEESDKVANKIDGLTMHYKNTAKSSKALKMGSGKLESDNTYIEILNDLELMGKLKAENFDVGIGEAFMLTEYSFAVFHFLGIPKTIATHSQPISPVQFYLLGVMSKLKSGSRITNVGQPTLHLAPNSEERRKLIGTRVGDHRDSQLEKRGTEIWEHCLSNTLNKIRQYIIEDTLYQKVADEKYNELSFPGFAEIFRRTRFFLVNSQPEVDFSQFDLVKEVEKVKFIGGFNLEPIQNPKLNLSIYLHSNQKIVLVSFGTVVNTNVAESSTIIDALYETMKKFPDFLFICKLTEGHPNGTFMGLENVITQVWVDQKNILAHPKTKAFVSHCGMNSVLEGIYNGVPMICVPFFGDQFYNGESLARQQIGLVVDREQDKDTVHQQLTVALAKALGQNELLAQQKQEINHSEDQIDFEKLQKVKIELRQKNIVKTISDMMEVIEGELRN